jgi:hypothetical protein
LQDNKSEGRVVFVFVAKEKKLPLLWRLQRAIARVVDGARIRASGVSKSIIYLAALLIGL